MQFSSEEQLRAFFEAQQRKGRPAEYDVNDEPSFAEWIGQKASKTRVAKGLRTVTKSTQKATTVLTKFVCDYSFLVGSVATALYFGYIVYDTTQGSSSSMDSHNIDNLDNHVVEEVVPEPEPEPENALGKIKKFFSS